MCARLGIPRASYYRWLDQRESVTAARHRELTGHIKTMFDSSDGIFGHRMVHTKLAAAGVAVSVGTVAAIMAENGWAARRMRAFKRTTIPSDPDKVFSDLIGRDFTSAAPGTKLVGDITYLRTGEGWLYLATVIDLCTPAEGSPAAHDISTGESSGIEATRVARAQGETAATNSIAGSGAAVRTPKSSALSGGLVVLRHHVNYTGI